MHVISLSNKPLLGFTSFLKMQLLQETKSQKVILITLI